jgi:energy-coupling factor transporter ATP-binding protein EcfA2
MFDPPVDSSIYLEDKEGSHPDCRPERWSGGTALAMRCSASVSEVFRAGIESIHPSQAGAALALGLTPRTDPSSRRAAAGHLTSIATAAQRLHRAAEGRRARVGPRPARRRFASPRCFAASQFNYTPLLAAAALSPCVTIPLTRIVDLEEIHDGDILLDGEPITTPGIRPVPIRRCLGLVFQAYNWFPHLSVIDNVTLGAVRAQRMPVSEARAAGLAMLERFGLADRSSEHPDRLSGGQQQRVAIARALLTHPQSGTVLTIVVRARTGQVARSGLANRYPGWQSSPCSPRTWERPIGGLPGRPAREERARCGRPTGQSDPDRRERAPTMPADGGACRRCDQLKPKERACDTVASSIAGRL